MHKYIKLFTLCFCLLATSWATAAVSVRASVNKTALTLDDELILTITVDGAARNVTPQLPSLPAFNVYSRNTSTQIINGHMTTTFDYIMMPRFPGKVTIDPISITYAGNTYQTNPIQITVYRSATQAKANPASNKSASQTARVVSSTPAQVANTAEDIKPASASMPALERNLYNLAAQNARQPYFVIAAVDNLQPYVNQTATLAVRFYYSRPFAGSAPYTAPTISNLFLDEIGRSDGQQVLGNTSYTYTEIRYGITGVTAGKAQIGAAKVSYVPMEQRALSIFSIFTNADEEKTIQSKPIALNIRAVPSQEQPHSFYGAVGSDYSITASVDRTQVEAGDAINLTIKVNGTGNLKATTDLKLPSLPGFRSYEVVSSAGIVTTGKTLKSYKVFKTVLVPLSSGQYTIPSIFWSYYDPLQKQYLTIKTQPISLQVTPASSVDTGFDFRAHADSTGGIQTLGQDIHYIKDTPFTQNMGWLSQVSTWNLASILALCALCVTAILSWVRKKTPNSHLALPKAKALLRKAQTEENIANALSTYLQIRYGIHTASLPLRQIQEELKAHNCTNAQLAQFANLWQQLEAARFAPASSKNEGVTPLVKQALQLITQLDKGARK